MEIQARILGIYFVLSILLLVIASFVRSGIHYKRTEPEGDGFLSSIFGRANHPKNRGFRKVIPFFIKLEDEPLLTPNDVRVWNTWTKVTYFTIGLMIVAFIIFNIFRG